MRACFSTSALLSLYHLHFHARRASLRVSERRSHCLVHGLLDRGYTHNVFSRNPLENIDPGMGLHSNYGLQRFPRALRTKENLEKGSKIACEYCTWIFCIHLTSLFHANHLESYLAVTV